MAVNPGTSNHVVDFGAVAHTLVENLNKEQLLNFISAIATQLANYSDQKDADLQNQITALQQQLQEVYKKAEILDKFELGQVEEAIKEALQNLDALGLFDSLCLSVNGQNSKLSDFVQSLITFQNKTPQNISFVKDPSTNEITALNITLLDGSTVNLPVQKEDIKDDNNNIIGVRFYGTTDKWVPGLTVSFEVIADKVDDKYNFSFGNIVLTTYELKEYTNPVLSVQLTTCTPGTPESTTPDLNKDGTIGTPSTSTADNSSTTDTTSSDNTSTTASGDNATASDV